MSDSPFRKKKSTWFFSCETHAEQKEFETFLRSDISLSTFVVFNVISSLGSFYFKGRMYLYNRSALNLFSLLYGVFFELVFGTVLLALQYFVRHNHKHTLKHIQVLGVIENLFAIALTISRILVLVSYISNGRCRHDETTDVTAASTTVCSGYGGQQTIPEGMMTLMLIYPMMLSMIVKSVKSEIVFLLWAANSGMLIALFFLYDFKASTGQFFAIAGVSLLSLWEFQRQKISMFFLSQELIGSQTENERLEKENRASELKHLIGNVAHDLKTPLSSLNMGIDLIATVTEEAFQELVRIPDKVHDVMFGQLQSIAFHLRNMRNVNAFMLMNINRCMDYTKATNGLKLVPHIETAPLIETIALPLHVMNAMQGEQVQIELLPVPKEICSHIITDKQWLEENILCLLSNAVKYSHKGVAKVSVSLVHRTSGALDSNKTQDEENEESPSEKVQRKSSGRITPSTQISPSTIWVDDLSLSASISSSRLLKLDKHMQNIRIEVEDTGIGLSDEVMASLFSPFKQAQRLAGGTGLGLFSLSRRVEAIGGRYGVTQRQDGQQGSVFWFEIPYKPDSEYACNMSELTQSVFSPESPSRKIVSKRIAEKQFVASAAGKPDALNILLVEDTLSIQKMTRMLLQKQGHTVTVADNGVEALERITTLYAQSSRLKATGSDAIIRRFDVVLMDFQMPVMDGLEATRRIRALESQLWENVQCNLTVCDVDASDATFHQLIIGLSANSDDETVQLARSEGMDDFMEKPFKAAVFNEICAKFRS